MTIAEKLQAIAQNEQKVYNAGKIAVLKASKYLNATASGTVVSVQDVSPVEHDVAVRLSSDTVTDFSDVAVKRPGKNLIDMSQFTFVGCVNNGDGSLTANLEDLFRCRMETKSLSAFLMANRGKAFTFSVKGQPSKTRLEFVVYGKRADGSGYQLKNGAFGEDSVTLTVATDFTKITSLDLRMLGKEGRYDDTTTVISDIQLELGSAATAYEPYVEPTVHTASTDGVVDGVKSLSPSMTLLTETDGVTITCAYLRDVDAYIDGLTGGAD